MAAIAGAYLFTVLPHKSFDSIRQLCSVVMLFEKSLGITLELICAKDASQLH